MKPLIFWFALGACLLLFGCSGQERWAFRDEIPEIQPSISYCQRVDLLYNDGFAFSIEEDMVLFEARVAGALRERRVHDLQIPGRTLFEAVSVVSDEFYRVRPGGAVVAELDASLNVH